MNKDQLAALGVPFPKSVIKQRRESFGEVDYVEGAVVIARLNEALDGQWSLTIEQQQVYDRTRFDKYKKQDVPYQETVALVRLETHGDKDTRGVTKMSYGGSDTIGKCLADALKAATTDAMKKAASMLGVALHLYTDTELPTRDAPDPPPPETKKGKDPATQAPPPKSEPASADLLSVLESLRGDPRLPDKWRTRVATRLADGNVPANQADQMKRACVGQIQAATGIEWAPWEILTDSQRGAQLAAIAKRSLGPDGQTEPGEEF